MDNLVYTYLTRVIEEYDLKPQEMGGSGGAIYLPYMVLHHNSCSTQKGMSLGTRSLV